jgi:predicted component of type VI protein secretion system
MRVQKKHATIRRVGDRYLLVNNGAPPGDTLVNEAPVPDSRELQDGDRIQLGNVILRFQRRAAVNRARAKRPLPALGS